MTHKILSLLLGESFCFHSLGHQNSHNYLLIRKGLPLESMQDLLLCALCSNAFVQAIALALDRCSRT